MTILLKRKKKVYVKCYCGWNLGSIAIIENFTQGLLIQNIYHHSHAVLSVPCFRSDSLHLLAAHSFQSTVLKPRSWVDKMEILQSCFSSQQYEWILLKKKKIEYVTNIYLGIWIRLVQAVPFLLHIEQLSLCSALSTRS